MIAPAKRSPGTVIARASVPASIANMGSGFDVHSMALQLPRIEVELAKAPRDVHDIRVQSAFALDIPLDPTINAAGKALNAVRRRFGKPEGYVLTIHGNFPPKIGLGLSGAEAVGAVLCASIGFDLGLSREGVARMAAKAEPMQHMDNVAASAMGGFNIVSRMPMNEQTEITTIRPPNDLGIAVVVPSVKKTSTGATREFLPLTVSREHYVKSMSYASRLSAAFAYKDLDALLGTLPWDDVVEPARAAAGVYGKGVNPDFLLDEKKLLLEKFHVAETISGAGPARALWYDISEDLKKRREGGAGLIKPAIALVTKRLEKLGYSVRETIVTTPSSKGATVARPNRRFNSR